LIDNISIPLHPIDEKGRLSIARKWIYDKKPIVVAKSSIIRDSRPYLIGCLEHDIIDYVENLYGQDSRENRKIDREVYANAEICPLDYQGRIRIPKKLLSYIGIEGRANVVINEVYSGIGVFEIWNVKNWKTRRVE
jgi:DNA-binding transcriptional regulator/RsmH inhibitor MraZ